MGAWISGLGGFGSVGGNTNAGTLTTIWAAPPWAWTIASARAPSGARGSEPIAPMAAAQELEGFAGNGGPDEQLPSSHRTLGLLLYPVLAGPAVFAQQEQGQTVSPSSAAQQRQLARSQEAEALRDELYYQRAIHAYMTMLPVARFSACRLPHTSIVGRHAPPLRSAAPSALGPGEADSKWPRSASPRS